MNQIKRLVIFAGYDEDNKIYDYVVYYIKELKKIADIIYVSDCDMLDSELEKISPYCIHIINGRHGEYDFGSYKRGYLYAYKKNILKDYNYLMLINDSVFGPFIDLENLVKNVEEKNTDVWGISKHLKDAINEEHLQSYFISMKKKVYLSEEYYNFLTSVKKEEAKRKLVVNYEIGQSILFNDLGLSIFSLLDSSCKSDESIDNNVILFDPLCVLENGFPFLKIFGFKNFYMIKEGFIFKMDINYLHSIINLIKNNYDIKLIVDYLNDKHITFPKFYDLKKSFISKKIFYMELKYLNDKQTEILIKIFSFISMKLNIKLKCLYYANFNFILKWL